MDNVCPEFEHRRERLDTWNTRRDDLAWEAHLAQCPDCREQWTAEKALVALFEETVPPTVSSTFNQDLHQRIANAQAHRRWPLLIMKGYWVAASLISVVIFLNMNSISHQMGWVMTLLALSCFLAPTFLLGRRVRFGLFDLIVSTMTLSEERSNPNHEGLLS